MNQLTLQLEIVVDSTVEDLHFTLCKANIRGPLNVRLSCFLAALQLQLLAVCGL